MKKLFYLPSFRKYIILCLLIVFPALFLGGNLLYSEFLLDKSSKTINAKINKIEQRNNRYFIEYGFSYQKKEYKNAYNGTQSFFKGLEKNNKIEVVFYPKNPKNNRIKAIGATNTFNAMIFVTLGLLFLIIIFFRLKGEYENHEYENENIEDKNDDDTSMRLKKKTKKTLRLIGFGIVFILILQIIANLFSI